MKSRLSLDILFSALEEQVKAMFVKGPMKYCESQLISREFDTNGKYKYIFTFMNKDDFKKYQKKNKNSIEVIDLSSNKRKNKLKK